MTEDQRRRLRAIKNFKQLVDFLRDELDWPIDHVDDEDDLTFDWSDDLGLKESERVGIQSIKQLRPLESGQPWGIFFVSFEKKRLPIVVLRRILNSLVMKKRASANRAQRAAWKQHDLLFISSYGEDEARQLTFAHFSETNAIADAKATLRVLGWDDDDTNLKLDYVADTLKEKLTWPVDSSNLADWRKRWAEAFELRHRQVIDTAEDLARRLAELAKRIRHRMLTVMPLESEKGELQKLLKGFKTSLIHDLDEKQFADMYAQTITYGLFSASVSQMMPGATKSVAQANVVEMVPATNPFLREMLQSFLKAGGRKGKLDFDELGIQEVVDLLNDQRTNMAAVLRDFGNKTRGEDPVIHFYETFLEAYDKQIKFQRGVFYTPQPVVSYIVRSVHKRLQGEFGLVDGLADTATWGEMLKKHPKLNLPLLTDEHGESRTVSMNEAFVQILDPATGTATFLVEVIDVIYRTLETKWVQQRLSDAQRRAAWNEYVPKHLLPRLHAFELMMAPYAIAHMKVGLKLAETGYRFAVEERLRIYLTNALEPWVKQLPLIGFEALAHEAAAVNEIKRHKRFTVVIGNPPYSIRSGNLTGEAKRLIEPFKFIDGQRLVEKGALQLEKNLNDDYVKFFGLFQKQIDAQSVGIVGVIANHAFFDNPTFRGFRWNLLSHFTSIQLLDLHGNSKKKEQVPIGFANENVFDIQQGVAICILTRHPTESTFGAVSLAEQWGTREEKYRALEIGRFHFREIDCPPPYFKMSIQDAGVTAEFNSFVSLADAMPLTSTGIKTHRDAFVIDFDEQALRDRVAKFRSNASDASIAKEFGLADTHGWRLSEARKRIRARRDWQDAFQLCLYRPFDLRNIYYHADLVELPRAECMQNLIGGKNLALLATRQVTSPPFNHVFVTRLVSEMKTCSHDRGTNCFPLYLREQGSGFRFGDEGRSNFSVGFIRALTSALQIAAAQEGALPTELKPEDIFQYAYAVFHSPSYRLRYAEPLKTEFPRLPLIRNLELFRAMATLGGRLIALHLLESEKLSRPNTEFVGDRNAVIEKASWSRGTVWIDKAQQTGFRGVREEVWTFNIGGYPVCEKWLKDRKGRVISKDETHHYQKIITALSETIQLMTEIDVVIGKYGGWPAAFQNANEPKARETVVALLS